MRTQTIRRKFLEYFQKQQHRLVPSSPVVPHDDPTLLFVNAGMNQFKDVFLGKSQRDYTRAASSQKCIRVGGKHNDLENVGHTARHLTFFEMLGNFSFGDYFKPEAIQMAWEVSTEVFGFEADRIWASVFREDDEAFALWEQYLPKERIVRLGERDNFWAMGETGPCGPCSELLYDRGPEFGLAPSPYEDTSEERYPEFWNLVFMQYSRDEHGVMTPLPAQSIDTGGGLERIAAFKSGVSTLFETDVLRSLIEGIEELSGKRYDGSAPFHVLADHIRCLCFAIADGVQPSNVDRGYVLRKVLRRAVRYGRQIGLNKPFMRALVPRLCRLMGEDFPELVASTTRIEEILTLEEEGFLRTLSRGGNLLGRVVERSKQADQVISGDDAFKLKDTYGLPLEEILLLAKDDGLTVDFDRYQALEAEAKERSKARHKVHGQVAEESLFAEWVQKQGPCRFMGYTQTTGKGRVVGLVHDGALVDRLESGQEGMILLDQTPFYAEKGGQVGDAGHLAAKGLHFAVSDTQEPFSQVVAHVGVVKAGSLEVGQSVEAHVDRERRRHIAANHTATHLLHWALQEVLGAHVRQLGSVVDAERLRFDFSHHKALTFEELRRVEDLVNDKVRGNLPVQSYEMEYAQAQEVREIKQFFGDKYGDTVRVVDIDYSKELCGGTHTSQTGNIGLFRIAKESSIAAGTRRIEAVTGQMAMQHDRVAEDLLAEVAEVLGSPVGKLLDRASKVLEENTHYAREMKAARKGQLGDKARALAQAHPEAHSIVARVDVELSDLREMADQVLNRMDTGVVVLGSVEGDRCALCVKSSVEGVHAGKLIKELAPLIGGGGGGRAELAQAGGKDPSKLDEALETARDRIRQSLT